MLACAGGDVAGGTSDVVAVVPFLSGERLTYELYNDAGEIVARATFTTVAAGDALELVQRYEEAAPPAGAVADTDTTVTTVDATTLLPRSMQRDVSSRAGGEERFAARYVRDADDDGDRVLFRTERDGETQQRDQRLREHSYDNESSLWLWRAIELVEGYEARYISVNAVERGQQTVLLRVIDRRTVEVPAGGFETWRVQVRTGRATRVAWIDVEPPHRVVQWDNGTLVFRLSEIASE